MFTSGMPSDLAAIARSYEPWPRASSKPRRLPNRRIIGVRCINLTSFRAREAPPWRPIGVWSMPWSSSSSCVCVYSREVTSTS